MSYDENKEHEEVMRAISISHNPDYIARGGRYWKSRRKDIKERDNFSCRKCGSRDRLIVHHIVPIVDGGGNEDDNLITLCSVCHYAAHHNG